LYTFSLVDVIKTSWFCRNSCIFINSLRCQQLFNYFFTHFHKCLCHFHSKLWMQKHTHTFYKQ